MIQTKTAYSLADTLDNPCFGCVSVSCVSCPCADERLDIVEQMRRLKVPVSAPKAKAKRETAVPAEKQEQPVKRKRMSSVRGFESFEVTKRIPVPPELFGKVGEGVVLTATGDGMRNAGIRTGDWLVFDVELQPNDGDIVMATVNGQMMCRRYFREGEQYRIRREDGCTPDIITSDCIILGVLVGLTRRYANRR